MPDQPPPTPPVPWHRDDESADATTLRQGHAIADPASSASAAVTGPAGAATSSDEEATLARGSQPDTLPGSESEATLVSPLHPPAGEGGAEATLAGDGSASAASHPSTTDSRARESTGTPVDGDLPGAPVHVEQAGRYLVKRQYGAGGQGVVWLAIDATVGREVALKALDVGRVLAGGGTLAGVKARTTCSRARATSATTIRTAGPANSAAND